MRIKRFLVIVSFIVFTSCIIDNDTTTYTLELKITNKTDLPFMLQINPEFGLGSTEGFDVISDYSIKSNETNIFNYYWIPGKYTAITLDSGHSKEDLSFELNYNLISSNENIELDDFLNVLLTSNGSKEIKIIDFPIKQEYTIEEFNILLSQISNYDDQESFKEHFIEYYSEWRFKDHYYSYNKVDFENYITDIIVPILNSNSIPLENDYLVYSIDKFNDSIF